MRRPSVLTLAAMMFLVWTCPAFARPQKGGGRTFGRARPPASASQRAETPIEEFERMAPEEQQRSLARLPAAQRKRIVQQLQKFNQLPPEQRQALNNLYSRLHQLPPRRQQTVHDAIDRFSKLPMDRQQAIRSQLRALAPLSAEDRAARLANQDFRHSFSRREQGIVRDMLPLLPSK
ncbi:MAG TPA: DUF3106 domain-containing protein [Bryobacteraceae bacterium]|nr:DUF3106 domain-containing protein [Bryobacteraceae bacterium]